jgi:hypothetical protein
VKVLYIAGPYRGRDAWAIEYNIRRAEAVALEVWAMGIVALCPHTMTRFYQGALPEATWLAGDLELLKRCDGVLAIARWQESTGASIEVRYALERGLPVFYALSEIEEAWGEEAGPVQLSLPFMN